MNRAIVILLLSVACLASSAQQEYSVKQGETIEGIARKFGATVDELKRLNPDLEMWFAGLVLNVPADKATATSLPRPEAASEPASMRLDKIVLRDGSYVLCKILQASKANITFSQNGEDGKFTIAIRDIKEINYADGSKRKYVK